jgi:hypothetical protein
MTITPPAKIHTDSNPLPISRPNYHLIRQPKEIPKEITTKVQWNVEDHIQAPIALKPKNLIDYAVKQYDFIQYINNY